MQRHSDPPCPLSEQKFLPSTRGYVAAALHHEFASGIILEAALAHQQAGVPDIPSPPAPPESITVPEGLANIVIESGKATDYDHLLLTDGGSHE
jgi:hypothetical protein